MNESSTILLLGLGTSGCAIARGVSRAFGAGIRYLLADTDASTALPDEPFILLGGDRLSGHGAGGDSVAARLATEDSIKAIDESLEGVRLIVIVTSLGGGTGSGATPEVLAHLQNRGIPAIVFATMPFSFEGADRQRTACGAQPLIEGSAGTTFFLPLDKLVAETDNMKEALARAIGAMASGVTLFWRLVEKAGYIRLDAERIRHLCAHAGRGRFAIVSAQGENRAAEAVEQLVSSPLLATGAGPVHSILCGILAGDDLRLSELSKLSGGIRAAFGDSCAFDLGTVNDEATFAGRLAVVLMLFENSSREENAPSPAQPQRQRRRTRRTKNPLDVGPSGRGRFNNAEPTIWDGEDLDVPTFLRKNISLDR